MRDFNTAGPVRADRHYAIPPLERLNLGEVLALVRGERYFVLHAPRQTGKTSTLLALRDLLNSGSEGDYRCVYVNVEPARTAREDVALAMRNILNSISDEARVILHDDDAAGIARALDTTGDPHGALVEFLARWAAADPRPLVLLIDETDALVGDSLVSVLRQLRTGYVRRPEHFPASVVLCGVRDVPRLPHSRQLREGGHRGRRRVQHQGQVAPHGRLHPGGRARAPGTAHGPDRAGVRAGGARSRVGADSGPAVARERARPGDVLRARASPAPRPSPRRGSPSPRQTCSRRGRR